MAEVPTTPPPMHRDLDALEKIANSKIDPENLQAPQLARRRGRRAGSGATL